MIKKIKKYLKCYLKIISSSVYLATKYMTIFYMWIGVTNYLMKYSSRTSAIILFYSGFIFGIMYMIKVIKNAKK